jgi:AraC-like DNA-binding protein
VSAYRNQFRVREALERLAEGERSLTGLANDLGFADHAHLARTVRREAGAVPSVLRRLLAAREVYGCRPDRLGGGVPPGGSHAGKYS